MAEAACLAAIPKSPETLNPFAGYKDDTTGEWVNTGKQKNKKRQEYVLWQMYNNGALTYDEYQAAVHEKLVFTDSDEYKAAHPETEKQEETDPNQPTSWIVDAALYEVADYLKEQFNLSTEQAISRINRGGYQIYTTVDQDMQAYVEEKYKDLGNLVEKDRVAKWEDQNGDGEYSSDEIVYPESAFVAMNYKGEIKAMVGATGEKTQSLCFNYATMEQRQPGSTIKPLTTYGLALESDLIHWGSIYKDEPIEVEGKAWPTNYSEDSPAGQYRPYTYQALATLGQPLYTGGSLMARKKIAKADEELDKLATELTLDQIHYQSDAVYWNASAALATLKAAARFEGIVSQQYNIIQDRFNDGAISRTDLLMISTRKKEAELQYIKARQNYTLALQQLNILMGVKPDAAVDSLCEIGMHCPPVDLLSLDEVLSRRADYAGTHVSIARSEAQRKAALSQYNPQLSMFLATGWDTGIAYMGQDVPHTPIAGINLNIPIFRWGARFKTNRQQKAYIGIQKLQQSYVADTILEELSAATTKLTETEQQVKTARENMALAEENLDLVTFSYNEGKASMVDVLSAQLSWTQAQTNLINAHLAAKMAVAEYRKAISE